MILHNQIFWYGFNSTAWLARKKGDWELQGMWLDMHDKPSASMPAGTTWSNHEPDFRCSDRFPPVTLYGLHAFGGRGGLKTPLRPQRGLEGGLKGDLKVI